MSTLTFDSLHQQLHEPQHYRFYLQYQNQKILQEQVPLEELLLYSHPLELHY